MKKTFSCIDAHTCGNPVRVVTGGLPFLEGENMFEKRQFFIKHYDWIRRGLMFEPRGHDMMSGSMLYPPHDPENDVAVLYIETSGCLPMCGHGTIGTVTVAIEEGLITPKVPGKLRLETPAGLVLVSYTQEGEKVTSVKLTNVPSFVIAKDLNISCDVLGELIFDVSYGGNFYAIIEPQENFGGLQDFTAEQLITMSRKLRKAINEVYTFVHPENSRINGLSHIQWIGRTLDEHSHGRNAVFYGDKAIDRSPCGTGTSARMAQLYSRGLLKANEPFVNESYIGSTFTGEIIGETNVGDYDAIIPSIEGWAKITGYNTIFLDDDDPYVHGFQVI
ncbi:4-hydroxyproline epimerase [Echinicola vietnamensis]|uniref:Proline racemase n=1 Tax=Echinicola vietnamensis (strain DSM 17526 / LMG 23754 / KMM 6221) TaxID=926556 RepID=L0G578_ECHVK|nr:4-hydroxyproline epimerase [Echinicola vietnamensis]AGA80161.1 proline racemase [Echinicola vietnamensis DSM 17526]